MKITFDKTPGLRTDKISAIKAIRNATGLGLKETKQATDAAAEDGEVNIPVETPDIHRLNATLRGTGYAAVNADTELVTLIEKAIAVAVEIKEYKKARTLINILPSVERDRYKEGIIGTLPSAE